MRQPRVGDIYYKYYGYDSNKCYTIKEITPSKHILMSDRGTYHTDSLYSYFRLKSFKDYYKAYHENN